MSGPSPGTSVIAKVAGIVLTGGLLLVVRKRGTDVFISPGGKPERGETPQQTLARELHEETGTTLHTSTPLGSFSDVSAHDPDHRVHIDVWDAAVHGVAQPSSEIAEIAWVDSEYLQNGVRLGSVLERFVVPRLVVDGRLRIGLSDALRRPAAVIVDLDGTVAFSGRIDPDCAVELERLAADHAVRLVLATSRAPRGVRRLVGGLADRCELICCNGAMLLRNGAELTRSSVAAAAVDVAIATARSQQADFYLEYGERFIASDPARFPWLAGFGDNTSPAGAAPIHSGVVKVCLRPQRADGTERIVAMLREGVGPTAQVDRHSDGTVDMVASGTTKATAATLMVGDLRNVVAFGNDANDFELLARSGQAVVVGTGLPGLERASHVQRVPADGRAVAAAMSTVRAVKVN